MVIGFFGGIPGYHNHIRKVGTSLYRDGLGAVLSSSTDSGVGFEVDDLLLLSEIELFDRAGSGSSSRSWNSISTLDLNIFVGL